MEEKKLSREKLFKIQLPAAEKGGGRNILTSAPIW